MNNFIIIQLFFNNLKFKYCIISIEFFLLLILLLINKNLKTYNNNLYKFKIIKFKLTHFVVSFYFCTYFGLLLYIRYTYLSKEVNLKPIIQLLYNITLKRDIQTNTLIIISLLLMSFCFILVLKLINDFFVKLLMKEFIYLCHGKEKKYDIIINIIENYSLLSLKSKVDHIYLLIHLKMADIFPRIFTDKLYYKFINLCKIIFFNLPFVIFIIYFLYEILCNNLILSINFNRYVLFFVCYNIYKRVSAFLINTNMFINKILFNLYYRAHSIKYVNVPEIYQNNIQYYIYNDIQHTSETRLNIFNHEFEFEHNNIFVTLNGIEYFNYKNESFNINDNTKDIVNYNFKEM